MKTQRSALTIPPYAWQQMLDLKNRVVHTQLAALKRMPTHAQAAPIEARLAQAFTTPMRKG